MSITPGRTTEEIRAFVFEYECLPYGTKTAWLQQQGVTTHVLRRWRDTMFEGDLDKGLIPRDGVGMSASERRHQAAKQSAARDAELRRLRDRVAELEATNDALGKAIGLLHAMNEQEPGEPPTISDPPSS